MIGFSTFRVRLEPGTPAGAVVTGSAPELQAPRNLPATLCRLSLGIVSNPRTHFPAGTTYRTGPNPPPKKFTFPSLPCQIPSDRDSGLLGESCAAGRALGGLPENFAVFAKESERRWGGSRCLPGFADFGIYYPEYRT